jgi:hypothetical protein
VGAKVYKWVNGKKTAATSADIKVGSKVQCVFTGPINTTNPIQASASEVIILQERK